MSAWILIPVFVAGMLTGGTLVLMWANHPWTIPEGGEETMEAKTAAYWQAKGYSLLCDGECSGCSAPVEYWEKGPHIIPLDPSTFETHFSTCPAARDLRMAQRMEAGIL